MAETTAIEWCTSTWSPVWGCTQISPACDHCYAQALAHRFGYGWNGEPMREFGEHHWNEPIRWNKRAAKLRQAHAEAGQIHKYRRPSVFPSMCDPFDKDWPAGVRDRFWALIDETPELDWLLLTKRIGNAGRMLPDRWSVTCPPNVWMGATVINQEEFDRDVPKLLVDVQARVRFLSIEPMLGPINMSMRTDRLEIPPGLSWVIAGGESGPSARPSKPEWFRSLRDQCAAAGVPYLFKQWGEFAPAVLDATRDGGDDQDLTPWRIYPDGRRAWAASEAMGDPDDWPRERMVKVGKKPAGRLLDGRTHDAMPA